MVFLLKRREKKMMMEECWLIHQDEVDEECFIEEAPNQYENILIEENDKAKEETSRKSVMKTRGIVGFVL